MHFATYFDKNYIPQGVAMIESLTKYHRTAVIHLLAIDEQVHQFFLSNEHVRVTKLEDFESAQPELLVARGNRTKIEYYFTLTSAWCYYLICRPEVNRLYYVDADIYFYNKIDVAEEILKDNSILIIPHRFSESNSVLNQYGIYNVGFIGWNSDSEGKKCLLQWKQDCLDWCYDRLEGDRFADQKYLDKWPILFNGVHVSTDKGLNVAYYNVGQYKITRSNDGFLVDQEPLLFFHFHRIQRIHKYFFNLNLLDAEGYSDSLLIKSIYIPYISKLKEIRKVNALTEGSIRYKSDTMKFINIIKPLFFDYLLIFSSIYKGIVHLESVFTPLVKLNRLIKGAFSK